MAAIWTNPDFLASQQLPSLGVTSSFREAAPGYATGKFQKLPQIKVGATDFLKVPFPMIGMDTATGQRDQDIQSQVGSPIPKMDTEVQKYLDFYKAISPTRMAEMEQAAQLSSRLTREQLASLYPYLSAAGAESTARNLAASKSFLATKEQMPSSVQAIMASKQGQMLQAASGEAERQRATAAQQEAAKRFAGSFAGQYIQVA
jgi:hypothetical protein